MSLDLSIKQDFYEQIYIYLTLDTYWQFIIMPFLQLNVQNCLFSWRDFKILILFKFNHRVIIMTCYYEMVKRS